jgi:ribonuclease HII
VFAVIELDVRRHFRNGPDRSEAVLRMANRHADVKGFDFHGFNLATDEARIKHSFFSREGREGGEVKCYRRILRIRRATQKKQADNAAERARLGTTMARAVVIDRFEFERALCGRGLRRVAGVDEAGRGPLAGPVVAAAAILPAKWAESGLPRELEGLNDSKQLTAMQRERYFAFLTACSEVEFAVAQKDSVQIDEINILRATHEAMNAALAELQPQPQHALVDGRAVKTMRVPQTAIIQGDARSYSIAAASVLAKVTRDRLMLEFDRQWPAYGFAEHKGYGTARHLAAIAAHGPCPIHRKSFAPLKPKETELF